jgi:hypothetical protein
VASDRHVIALIGFEQLADHPDTISRCAGRLPGGHRLEEMVLENEVVCVRPVVRYVPAVVVAHHVGLLGRGSGAQRVEDVATGAMDAVEGRVNEPVHRSAVDVGLGGLGAVGSADVDRRRVVVRAHAPSRGRVVDAHGGHAVPHGDPVRAGIGAEVGVERPVLLHDHDHVLDPVDPGALPPVPAQGDAAALISVQAVRAGDRPAAGGSRERQDDDQGGDPAAREHLNGGSLGPSRGFGIRWLCGG